MVTAPRRFSNEIFRKNFFGRQGAITNINQTRFFRVESLTASPIDFFLRLYYHARELKNVWWTFAVHGRRGWGIASFIRGNLLDGWGTCRQIQCFKLRLTVGEPFGTGLI